MNMIQKQVEMGRALFEINQNTFQELARTQQDNIKKYFELNTDFSKRLPEVNDISSFVELQREYNETLWAHTKSSFEAQTELLKGAFGNTREALKEAYTFETEEAPKPKAKAKAKPKAKAKKTAEAA